MKRSTSAISPAKDEPRTKRSKSEKVQNDHMEIDEDQTHITKLIASQCLRIGHPAPQFTAEAVSASGEFVNISLADYKGKYLVLFFYPLDFTFVCPTEIIAFSESIAKFKALDCEVLGVSVDSKFAHLAWINTPRKQGGVGALNIPLLADLNKEVSIAYNALYKNTGHTLRALFIIGSDEKQTLRHITMNDPPVGRSVDEVLRLVQAFQFNDKHGEVCPANWFPGAKTIVPDPKAKLTYFENVA